MNSLFPGYEDVPIVSLEEAVQPLLSVVSDIEQMVQTVKENCNQPANNLSHDESASIMLYTLPKEPIQSSFQFILNKTYRSPNRQPLIPWFRYLRLFFAALSKLPSSSHRVVFRSMRTITPSDYRKRKTLIWSEFISCTSSIERLEKCIDKNEAKAIYIIECDSAKDISEHSFHLSEHEILLYPGKHFQVISSWNLIDQMKFIQIKEMSPRQPLISIPQPSLTTISNRPTEIPTSNHFQPIHQLELIIDRCKQKSRVDLIRQNLIDTEMNMIVQRAIINKQCQILLLSENKITSVGATIIADALNENTTLEFLSLSYNLLYDVGIRSLTTILSLNNCRLKKLSLHSIGITDDGAEYLAEMLTKNTMLTWLHLGGNRLSDRGVQILANVLTDQNKTLEVLSLVENNLVSDLSVDSLVQMIIHNQTLNTLWIHGCSLSEEGREKLRKIVNSNKTFFVLTTEQKKVNRYLPLS